MIAVAAVAGAVGVLALTGGDDDEPSPATTDAPTDAEESAEAGNARTTAPEEEEAGGTSEEERQVERVVRTYVESLNAKDGRTVCELVPGVSDELELPVAGPSCKASVKASIGYRDPRGFPVWMSSEVQRVRSIVVEGSSARVSATVITFFADREPSIEDDTIHLENRRHRWRLAKPSATIYRAVGYPDVPPEVLKAP